MNRGGRREGGYHAASQGNYGVNWIQSSVTNTPEVRNEAYEDEVIATWQSTDITESNSQAPPKLNNVNEAVTDQTGQRPKNSDIGCFNDKGEFVPNENLSVPITNQPRSTQNSQNNQNDYAAHDGQIPQSRPYGRNYQHRGFPNRFLRGGGRVPPSNSNPNNQKQDLKQGHVQEHATVSPLDASGSWRTDGSAPSPQLSTFGFQPDNSGQKRQESNPLILRYGAKFNPANYGQGELHPNEHASVLTQPESTIKDPKSEKKRYVQAMSNQNQNHRSERQVGSHSNVDINSEPRSIALNPYAESFIPSSNSAITTQSNSRAEGPAVTNFPLVPPFDFAAEIDAASTQVAGSRSSARVRHDSTRNPQCPVCSEFTTFYGVSECDHAVCCACLTKILVLCKSRTCPVCRNLLSTVYFTKGRVPFAQIAAAQSKCIEFKGKLEFESTTKEEASRATNASNRNTSTNSQQNRARAEGSPMRGGIVTGPGTEWQEPSSWDRVLNRDADGNVNRNPRPLQSQTCRLYFQDSAAEAAFQQLQMPYCVLCSYRKMPPKSVNGAQTAAPTSATAITSASASGSASTSDLVLVNFENFASLQHHMRTAHAMHYCPLCVEHLRLFPFERRIYDKFEIAQHMNTGDRILRTALPQPVQMENAKVIPSTAPRFLMPAQLRSPQLLYSIEDQGHFSEKLPRLNSAEEANEEHQTNLPWMWQGDWLESQSYAGHPKCDLCPRHLLDHEELFRHRRRDHFFCQICDIDGTPPNITESIYYKTYGKLRYHYTKYHHMCVECERIGDQMMVFRSQIDLKAHILTNHSAGKSRSALNSAVQIDPAQLNFNFGGPRMPAPANLQQYIPNTSASQSQTQPSTTRQWQKVLERAQASSEEATQGLGSEQVPESSDQELNAHNLHLMEGEYEDPQSLGAKVEKDSDSRATLTAASLPFSSRAPPASSASKVFRPNSEADFPTLAAPAGALSGSLISPWGRQTMPGRSMDDAFPALGNSAQAIPTRQWVGARARAPWPPSETAQAQSSFPFNPSSNSFYFSANQFPSLSGNISTGIIPRNSSFADYSRIVTGNSSGFSYLDLTSQSTLASGLRGDKLSDPDFEPPDFLYDTPSYKEPGHKWVSLKKGSQQTFHDIATRSSSKMQSESDSERKPKSSQDKKASTKSGDETKQEKTTKSKIKVSKLIEKGKKSKHNCFDLDSEVAEFDPNSMRRLLGQSKSSKAHIESKGKKSSEAELNLRLGENRSQRPQAMELSRNAERSSRKQELSSSSSEGVGGAGNFLDPEGTTPDFSPGLPPPGLDWFEKGATCNSKGEIVSKQSEHMAGEAREPVRPPPPPSPTVVPLNWEERETTTGGDREGGRELKQHRAALSPKNREARLAAPEKSVSAANEKNSQAGADEASLHLVQRNRQGQAPPEPDVDPDMMFGPPPGL